MREIGFLHNLKVAFNKSFKLEIITNTDNRVKLLIILDLLAKTIIMPRKVILNSECLPRNFNIIVMMWLINGGLRRFHQKTSISLLR